jgi:acetyl esterase/lipase
MRVVWVGVMVAAMGPVTGCGDRLERRASGTAPVATTRRAGAAATMPAPAAAEVMNLWPGVPPGDRSPTTLPAETWNGPSLTNVSVPTLSVYLPAKGNDAHAAVIVCPGGGFSLLSMYHEGYDVCRWLNSIGVTAVLLKYRVPAREGMARNIAGYQDLQRAVSLVRANAERWGVDRQKVAVLGFSAGGQMVADVETGFAERAYPTVDAADSVSCRPDLAIAIYPGGIYRADPATHVGALTPDVHPTKETPPTFIAIATDDRNGAENGVYLYLALKKAGVNAELHVYAEGGHGFGIRPGTAPHTTWPARVEDWMRLKRFVPGRSQ